MNVMRENNKNRIWRMAFKCGNRGKSLWKLCKKLNVAAITYDPLSKFDLTDYSPGEPKALWKQLRTTQKSSLRHLAYDMKKGDIIYVKEGTSIAGKGVVGGNEKRSYRFDKNFRIIGTNGHPWPHQVPVEWDTNFIPIEAPKRVLLPPQTTVLELKDEKLEELYRALDLQKNVHSDLESMHDEENYGLEGGKNKKIVNYYERDKRLRANAIILHGRTCKACGFDFLAKYGERGKDFIEVHHLKTISSLKYPEKINPKNDMTVLCSNCHRMVHRKKESILSIEELKKIIKEDS